LGPPHAWWNDVIVIGNTQMTQYITGDKKNVNGKNNMENHKMR
jgi:hypothetical protein